MTSSRRVGATLTEVLMALLVMGLGLVSVATLFPLSLLRSVEATKITHATLARINAEARINASVGVDPYGNAINRAIIEDPDRDGIPIRLHQPPFRYVVDPLGAVTMVDDGMAAAIAPGVTAFGDFNADGRINAADYTAAPIPRFTGGYNGNQYSAPDSAERFVTLPDTYVSLADVLGGGVTVAGSGAGTQLVFNGMDLSEYSGQAVRVTLIRASVNDSVVIEDPPTATSPTVTVTGSNTIALGRGLPVGYSDDIARVTVEVRERRYTWVATVRRVGTKPSVTIAVFFRRSFDPADERIYTVYEPAGSYNEFEMAASVDPDSVTGALLRPRGMRVGGYMFDVDSFRWRKIVAIQDVTSATPPVIRFSTDPEEPDTGEVRMGVRAMFPQNVVEAYTLKK